MTKDKSLSFVNYIKMVLKAMYTNELRAIFSEPGSYHLIGCGVSKSCLQALCEVKYKV